MPWCPKCKSEYREGFTKCADCGGALVDSETFARLEEEAAAARRKAADRGEAAEFAFQEGESLCPGISDVGSPMPAFEEREREGQKQSMEESDASDTEPDGGSVSGRKLKRAAYAGSLYRDNAERASENRSSAWVLMAVGGVGILVLILGIMGVIPLHFSNAYLFYGVMAAVFILFLVAGIISMKNALVFEKSAESENVVRKTLLEWCRQNLRSEELDREIGVTEGEAKEILYFRRFEAIKARLNHQFLNLDQGFLEKLIDDTIYDMVYEAEARSAL